MELYVEYRLYHDYAYLRPSQVISLHLTHQQNLQALTGEAVQAMSPSIIFEANVAMNCAYALFTDWLFNSATAYAEPYHTSKTYATGRRLFQLFWSRYLFQSYLCGRFIHGVYSLIGKVSVAYVPVRQGYRRHYCRIGYLYPMVDFVFIFNTF